MNNETLLSRAQFNLEMAQYVLQKLDDGDERVLNTVGYNLQQSAELFLKHYLETESIGYPFSHDINLLIDLVEERGILIKLPESFKLIAGTLTEWEAKTRYVKNYVASRRAVLSAMQSIQDLFTVNGVPHTSVDISKYTLQKIKSFS